MIDFGFSPLPKTTNSADSTAELLKLGLEIFDRTFVEVGNWSGVQRDLFNDARILWTINCGHPQNLPERLLWTNWLPRDESRAIDGLKKFYHFTSNGGVLCFPYSLFKSLLTSSLVHRHFQSFEMKGDDKLRVVIPSTPAIFWIATFIDFLDKLKPQDKNYGHTRIKPSLLIKAENGNKLTITLTLDNTGMAKLESEYQSGNKTSGATLALP